MDGSEVGDGEDRTKATVGDDMNLSQSTKA